MTIDRAAFNSGLLENWPSVCLEALPPTVQNAFRKRLDAIELFSKGESLAVIEAETGVVRSQLYAFLKKATSSHADGRLYGYRALVPYVRVKRYQREAPIKRRHDSKGGVTGAMTNLLAAYPELESFLRKEIASKPLLFSSGKGGQLVVRGLRDIHRAFISQCRQLGLRDTDYPLNQDQKGIRSLSKVIKQFGSESFWLSAKKSGAARDKGHWRVGSGNPPKLVTRPYQAVELDGHLLDVRLSITCPGPFGYEQTIEVSRIWILVIVDIFTRVAIGYHLALSAEYNRHDVLHAIQKSILPHKPMNFTIPGLGYGSAGGFPSQILPELGFAVWDELRFDNAKAHLAAETLHAIHEELGCLTHAGPAREPDHRPFIERFFKTMTTTMSQRLPSATLSNPEELRRLLNATNQKVALAVPLEELEQLVEAVLASLNATPHESLAGRTPLQALHYWINDRQAPIRYLPQPNRENFNLLKLPYISHVRGNMAKGVRPYVSFFGARYSSPKLAERADLIGKTITLIYSPDDIRDLFAIEANGVEIGTLNVARIWNQSAHSLAMRRHILKLTRDGKLQMEAESDPVHAYLLFLRQEAPRRRQAATKLEAARRTINQATTKESPLKPPIEELNLQGKTVGIKVETSEAADISPAMPTRLDIPSGFSR